MTKDSHLSRTDWLRSRRTGISLVAALAGVTALGHLATQHSGATPTNPTPGGALDFASPGGSSVSFSGKLDRSAVLRGGDGQVKMELVLAAEERNRRGAPRTPTDFVVVLDRSGSMGGVKIEQARAAVRELVSQLTPDDRLALVSYASGAEVSIPLTPATEDARQHWRHIVAGIRAGGGTNMSSGLDLALDVTRGAHAGRAARLILISDGLANEGDASVEGLSTRAKRAAGREAVVSTVGVGADFNEFLMSQLADAGTGNYYYLKDVEQLAQVFFDELATSRETVATALAVSIAPGDGVRVVDAAGYPLEQAGGKTVFRPGSLFSGQERRIWVTLEVPNGSLGDRPLGTFAVRFKDPAEEGSGVTHVVELTEEPIIACVQGEGEYHESFDKDTWARAVAEEDYNGLQQRVAGYVREGRQEEAIKEIGDFESRNVRLNQVMKQEAISRRLQEVRRLQTEVEDAFQGANQADKRNQLSKTRQFAGRDGRRVGSKKAQSNPKGGS